MYLLLILLSFIGFLIFYYVQSAYKFWTNLGVKQLNPTFPFGDLLSVIKQEKSSADFFTDLYNRQKHEKFIGFYSVLKPILMINDPELVKSILVRDFAYFPERGVYLNEKADPLSAHMFSLPAERWKNLRMKLNSGFSPTKLKGMFPIIRSRAENLQKFVKTCDTFEVFGLMSRYTTDFIASAVFGYEIDSINDPTNEFYINAYKSFAPSVMTQIRHSGTVFFPKLMTLLGIHLQPKSITDFFFNVVQTNIEYREKNSVSRNDLLQFLMQFRSRGQDLESKMSESENLKMGQITAELYVFFLAGYETSSTTLAYCLYELARKPEIQRKVQAELDSILAEHGDFTYESLLDMNYLEQVMDETLRLYPPLTMAIRQCVKDYPIPGTDVQIPAKTMIMVPIMGLQRDENYFPNPSDFIPDRFTDPCQAEAIKSVYQPFGSGPRVCIGLRMAKVLVKIGLAQLLSTCSFELDKHQEAEFNKNAYMLAPKDGMYLKVSHRL